jgi:hypothetical protein
MRGVLVSSPFGILYGYVFTILCVGVSIRICGVLYYMIFCFFIFLLRIGIFISVFMYSIAGVTCIRIDMMIMLVLLLAISTYY